MIVMDGENYRIDGAFSFAVHHHGNQVDRGGTAYVVHLRNVCQRVHDAGGSVDAQVAAILHDVIEDTKVSISEVTALFGTRIAYIVGLVSKNVRFDGINPVKTDMIQAVPVIEYFSRIRDDEDARLVKLADLNHNLDLSRLTVVTEADIERFERYTVRYKYLMNIVEDCY